MREMGKERTFLRSLRHALFSSLFHYFSHPLFSLPLFFISLFTPRSSFENQLRHDTIDLLFYRRLLTARDVIGELHGSMGTDRRGMGGEK